MLWKSRALSDTHDPINKTAILLRHNCWTVEYLVAIIFARLPSDFSCILHYMIHQIKCQAVAVHRKCGAISVSRPHMFTALSGVPPERESVSSNVCSQQPALLSCSGYLGLHKRNRHAVWKWPPVSVSVLLLWWFLSLPDNWSLSISKDLHHRESCFALSLKTHMGRPWCCVCTKLDQKILACTVWRDCNDLQLFCAHICCIS